MRTIVICGANGFIGSHACKFFSEQGFKVIGLVRSADKVNDVKYADAAVVNYNDVNSISKALWNSDVVIDLVGASGQDEKDTYEQSNVMTTRNIVEACEGNRIKKFIYNSGLGAREGNQNSYFISRLLAEKEIIKSKLDYTIFRPSYIVGDGDIFTIRQVKQIKNGIVNVFGTGTYHLQPIFIDDALKIYLNTLDNKRTTRQIFDLVGPKVITFLEYIDMLSKHLGAKPKKNFIELEKLLQHSTQNPKMEPSFDEIIIRICDEVSDHKPLERTFGIKLIEPEDAIKKFVKR